MNKKIALSFLLLALSLNSCGYKPSTTYTKPLLGDKISTKVDIDIKNPTSSIFLKDSINEAVLSVFDSKLDKLDSNTSSKIILHVGSTSLSVLDYDKYGYPSLYRANASIKAEIRDLNGSVYSVSGSGNYDFSVEEDSIVTDELKQNAYKQAFLKALNQIEFKIAQKGLENNDSKRDK